MTIVAIDGPTGVGKSTTSRLLAERLDTMEWDPHRADDLDGLLDRIHQLLTAPAAS